MSSIEPYRRKYAFAEDYGTSQYKFGPLAEKPDVIENRGFVISEDTIIYKIVGITKRIIVGPEVSQYLGSREDMAKYLIYPMKDGIVEKDNKRAWEIVYEITKYGLLKFVPKGDPKFNGFYVTAALSAIAPKYMYEKIFEIHEKIDEEHGVVKAVTIIPQPLAVAIAQKTITCIVVESGHGNTQITPISRYPIRGGIISLNRGGAEANAITAEILKDNGYGDLIPEERLVRMVKESIGLIPRDLDKAIKAARDDKEKYRAVFKVPGTTISIDLGENSWMRFLIGEIVFNPEHEIFESYYKRGMPRPRDTIIGDEKIPGTITIGEAIARSASRTPLELQPHLYKKIILSGGNFAWKVPPGFENTACNAAEKVTIQLADLGLNAQVELTKDPEFSVWKGAIVYSLAVPDDYEWSWDRLEGWYKLH
ncbi:MAG: hypothetical protein DRJ44_01800 [Thermoprotei archaeon]|nr:MAG: hypothetical protein DRJ44_01800 [Thermoprotei archaeon]